MFSNRFHPGAATQHSTAPAVFEIENDVKRSTIIINSILKNKLLLSGSFIVLVFVGMAVFGPQLTPYEYDGMSFKERFAPPDWGHLMGTDNYGRDTFTRILYGARMSLKVGLMSVFIALISGVIVGAIAGFIGGFLENLLMRIMDAFISFPPMLLAVSLLAAIGQGLTPVAVCTGVIFMPRFARVMRAAVLAEKGKEYVEAARAVGQSELKILIKHIGPSTISPAIVMGSIVFALSIIIEASLSFLGVGIAPPEASWGLMLRDAMNYRAESFWLPFFPALVISLVVLGFNLLGDGLRDWLDPKNQ
jgi:peptide/nickel transport system permease protein